MPRKGGGKRGFMKAARHLAGAGGDESDGSDSRGADGTADNEPAKQSDSATPDARIKAAPASSSKADVADGGSSPRHESRGKMQQRHKRVRTRSIGSSCWARPALLRQL